MENMFFKSVEGIIQSINTLPSQCCQQMLSIVTNTGIVNMIVSPSTYVVNNVTLRPGMNVVGFYDANMPVPLIFPPQYQAIVISIRRPNENIAMDFFDRNLVGTNQSLKLNISSRTDIVTSNGQIFTCNLGNRLLIVYYSVTTRSIPPQTTPRKVIVMCK